MTAVTVPQLSISMEDARVSRWLVEDGAAVVAGQFVVEVETDKATVEIEAPVTGLLRIVAREGAIVAVEGVLAELESVAPEAADEVSTDGDGAARVSAPVESGASGAVVGARSRAGADRCHRISCGTSPGPRARGRARFTPGVGPGRAHRRA